MNACRYLYIYTGLVYMNACILPDEFGTRKTGITFYRNVQ